MFKVFISQSFSISNKTTTIGKGYQQPCPLATIRPLKDLFGSVLIFGPSPFFGVGWGVYPMPLEN